MSLSLAAFDLPAGYSAVAALGDALVLLQLEQGPTERLMLYADGQPKAVIAERPWNHFITFAADDRYVVWSESETEVDSGANDRWSVWAWDAESGESFTVARYAAPGAELGLPANLDVGPMVKISAGAVLWTAFDRTAAGTVLRLHRFNLKERHDTVLAAATAGRPLGSYDIRGQRVAYSAGDQLILLDGDARSVIATGNIGQVLLTDDAALWTEDQGRLLLHTVGQTRAVADSAGPRFVFSSSGHYVTWYSLDDDNLYLLRTPDGTEFKAVSDTIQGGSIVGNFVTWGVRDGHSRPPRTRAARLPQAPVAQ